MLPDDVFVIIPALNEAGRIGQTVTSVRQQCRRIVVVDDGSSDGTTEEALSAGAVVLRHVINRGQGASLQTGTNYALAQGAAAVVHFDADGQFLAEEIPGHIQSVLDGTADAVFGSRFLGRTIGLPRTKRWLLKISRLVNALFTGLWLTDAHNGFIALSRGAAERIRLTQDRMAYNTQLPAEVKRLGLRYSEQPVTVRYHRYGQGVTGGFRILIDLLVDKLVR